MAATGVSASSSAPVHGGTLVVAIDAQPTGFDPITADNPTPGAASVFNEIFASLTAPTASGIYGPYLAESLAHNKNDTRWVIRLRPGAEFADGTPIDANAVVFNLDRVKTSGLAFSQVQSFEASGSLTVVATMTRPWSAFPAALSGQSGAIASPTAINSEGKNFATKPVGSGPYELQSWSQGNQIVLVRNPHFFRSGMPYLDKVIYKIITDPSSRLAALQAGNVDVAEVDPGQAVAGGINTSSQYSFG
ncbi:MAG TPA: ABC transporter substrate-binding protein, partial [Acidimicrobiales bacterium]|nr:ABC transporter substrate-binding protein [Acidimicrobiales bacterium]